MNALPHCESNLTVTKDVKERSQVKCPLIFEIQKNHQDNAVCGDVSINKTHKDDSKNHYFCKERDTMSRCFK